MRSLAPDPGNPWPHDMVIHIEDSPVQLMLLFVRAAWGIGQGVELPPVVPAPEVGSSALPEGEPSALWDARWRTAWEQSWEWYGGAGRGPRPSLDELAAADPADRLGVLFPPAWEDAYGDDGIDREAFAAWQRKLQPDRSLPLAETPERRALEALVPAWEAGLTHLIVLPFEGYWMRRVSPSHVAISAATRNDPVLYDLALSTVI